MAATALHAEEDGTTAVSREQERGWDSPRLLRGAAVVIIAVGALLRISNWLGNRSLWFDEVAYALNVVSRSFAELLRPLDFDQTAPFLFSWAQRAMTQLFGVNEYALRLVPLLSGILLLVLLWWFVQRTFGLETALVATIGAAFSLRLLHYSTEAKAYGVDACITVILLVLALGVMRNPERAARWWSLVLGGAIAVLASLPAIMVLGGVAAALILSRRVRGSGAWRSRLAAAAILWTLLFVALCLTVYRPTPAGHAYQQAYWAPTLLVPGAPHFVARVVRFAGIVLVSPFDREAPPLILAACYAVTFAVGLLVIARRSDGIELLALLLVPLLSVALASAIGLYPLGSRLLLFVAPLTVIVDAAALVFLVGLPAPRLRRAFYPALVLGLLVWLLPRTRDYARSRERPEDTRPLIARITASAARDPVYVYSTGVPAWTFYTTDWKHPDLARVRRMAKLVNAGGPAFYYVPHRGHAVQGEGDSLTFVYNGRREIIGVGSGIFQASGDVAATHDSADSGWAENEVRRTLAQSDTAAWVEMSSWTSSNEVAALVSAFRRSGWVISEFDSTGSLALVFRISGPTPRASTRARRP
jgi:4-amino-4-deoxy-L-arabinose transferase-like glycosyltransferase